MVNFFLLRSSFIEERTILNNRQNDGFTGHTGVYIYIYIYNAVWFIIPRGLILCHHLLTIVFALSFLLIRHQGCCWIQSHVSSKENSWKHHRTHKNAHKLHLNSADWGTRSVLLYDCLLHLLIFDIWLLILSAMRHIVFFVLLSGDIMEVVVCRYFRDHAWSVRRSHESYPRGRVGVYRQERIVLSLHVKDVCRRTRLRII